MIRLYRVLKLLIIWWSLGQLKWFLLSTNLQGRIQTIAHAARAIVISLPMPFSRCPYQLNSSQMNSEGLCYCTIVQVLALKVQVFIEISINIRKDQYYAHCDCPFFTKSALFDFGKLPFLIESALLNIVLQSNFGLDPPLICVISWKSSSWKSAENMWKK